MEKKFLLFWSLWIGLISGVFCFVYANFPIIKFNIIFMAFVSVPLFLSVDAPRNLFPHYFFSAISGVIWGLIYLYCIKVMINRGFSLGMTLFVVVGVCTAVCCIVHMVILGNTWFNKVPMIFGGLACTFADGGQHALSTSLTLIGGLILSLLIGEGGGLIRKSINNEN